MITFVSIIVCCLFIQEALVFYHEGGGKIFNRPIILTFYHLSKENKTGIKFLMNVSQDVFITKTVLSLFFKYYIVGYGMNGVVWRFSRTARIIDNKIKELEELN